jgi:hypothetical protein
LPTGDLVVTPGGELLRASDGKAAAGGLHALWYTGPVVDGDRLFFLGSQNAEYGPDTHTATRAFRLASGAAPAPLWSGQLPGLRYYATPLVDGDLVHLAAENGDLLTIDARTGTLVSRLPPGAPASGTTVTSGTVFASPVIAGDHLFVNYDHSGLMLVYRRGATPTLVAKNEFEPVLATPYFSGKRMYVRSSAALSCIEER